MFRIYWNKHLLNSGSAIKSVRTLPIKETISQKLPSVHLLTQTVFAYYNLPGTTPAETGKSQHPKSSYVPSFRQPSGRKSETCPQVSFDSHLIFRFDDFAMEPLVRSLLVVIHFQFYKLTPERLSSK
jgi:hypothetical protein